MNIEVGNSYKINLIKEGSFEIGSGSPFTQILYPKYGDVLHRLLKEHS